MKALQVKLSIFLLSVRKEIVQQWRTKRFVVVMTVFLLIGLGSPTLVKMTPELVKSDPMGEELAKLMAPPTAADALNSYVEMIGLFGCFLAIILGMNAVAGEKESGTASLILSKPMPRWAFIVSKFAAQSLVSIAAFLVGGLAVFYCTTVLFGGVDVSDLIKASLILMLWYQAYVGAALLASVLGRTVAAAGGVGLGFTVLLSLSRNIPRCGPWTPNGLMAWAQGLVVNVDPMVVDPSKAIAGTVVLIGICLIGSVALFGRQEIE